MTVMLLKVPGNWLSTDMLDMSAQALSALGNDFRLPESIGPRRTAEFDGEPGEDLDAAADAHGYIDDLLRSCRRRGLE